MVLIVGTPDDNYLKGTIFDDNLQGLAGNDILVGDDGNDTLIGGQGDDALYGGLGNNDFLVGAEAGFDQFYGATGYDRIIATADNVTIGIGRLSQIDEISTDGFSSVSLVIGSQNNWVDLRSVKLSGFTQILTGNYGSQLIGTKLSDLILGGAGQDLINGGGGYDEIHGGGGNDRFVVSTGKYFGDDGEDQFLASGADQEVATLTGGAGIDTFDVVTGTAIPGSDFLNLSGVADIFTDFKAGLEGDIINLQSVISLTNFLIGWNSKTNPFVAGYFRLLQLQSDTIFQIDRTGSGLHFVDVIILKDVQATTLTASNFSNGFNPFNAILNGTTESDRIDGDIGNDTIYGLSGNDVIFGFAGADFISGDDGNDKIFGDQGTDSLIGGLGADTLDGGLDADTMDGGLGSDSFIVDSPYDVIIERFNEGTDTVSSSVSYALAQNLERLVLTGDNGIDGSGNELGNKLTGNGGDNHLYGMAGNDTLDGSAGFDFLEGGLGNDTYIIDETYDIIVENAGEGTDIVTANVSYALDANIETLILTGSSELTGMGNELNNSLTGNSANNSLYGFVGNDTLDGKGGADILIGGAGNDTYVVDSTLDSVVEYAGEGTDTVKANFTYVLSDPNLENLTLAGTLASDGTGNSAANSLTGNSATNHLYGLDGNDKLNGGAGADVLVGGQGNDSYTVENIGDIVTENTSEGTDSVSSSISYILGANLEKLTLSGSDDLDGTGNELSNGLTGNSGANDLYGMAGRDTLSGGLGDDWLSGGLGGDTLTGGAGKDRFVFDVLDTFSNRDTIKDFEHGIDDILISRSAFYAFAGSLAGALSTSAFVVGVAATTAAHRIVYNNSTGGLSYDPDGVGGQAQIQIASLSTKPILDAADFLLI